MGKGKNKNKEKDSYSGPRRAPKDEDYDSDESVSTHLTFDDDLRSVQGDDLEDVEDVIDKLAEHVENASHKNISIRMAALRHLQYGLTAQYLPEFVLKWKVTLMDLILKNLKKTDEECAISAILLALLAVQGGEEIGELIEEPLSLMRPIATDSSKSENLRAVLCTSISLTTHLASTDDASIVESIKALKLCWSSFKTNTPSTKLFTAALSSWALLLESADQRTLQQALNEYQKLTSYLEATQLDNRVACGETIAVVYEIARDRISESYTFPNHAQFTETLSMLSNDSSKIKAKKERRVQRYSFRQILSSIMDDDVPEVTIKFSRQALVIDTACTKLLYELCCDILRGGMMKHLESNELLRELFDLGPIPERTQKINKLYKMAMFGEVSKHRDQIRSKQRDKRAC